VKRKRALLLVALSLVQSLPIRATTFHDPIHTVLNVGQQVYGQVKQEIQHGENISKYTTMIQKQVEQINQLTSIIDKDVEQLRRFGDPNTYVNMLGLDALLAEVDKVKTGVGKTVAEFRQTADGLAALKNSGQGLYADLSRLPDKFGKATQYRKEDFKKFGVLQNMYDDFDAQLRGVNRSVSRLESDVSETANQMNRAGSLVETEKLRGKLQVEESVVNAGMQRATLAALKILVQGESNRNDQARVQEADRQRKAQEMESENQQIYMLGEKMLGPS
jgi:uncharacterized phage infection (PIP) family protein YhgE